MFMAERVDMPDETPYDERHKKGYWAFPKRNLEINSTDESYASEDVFQKIKKENNFTAVSTPSHMIESSSKDNRFSEFSRMLHTSSVIVDNSSDKLTITETETENQSGLDFESPLKTPTL